MTELLFEGPSGPRLQRKHLEAMVRNQCFKFTDTFFPYTSGEIGPYFVNSENIMRNGQNYFEACKDLANGINLKMQRGDKVEIISGGETRDWIFSYPVATSLGLPHASVYKDGKILGADVMNKWVLHFADLNNEGSSPRDYWVPTLAQSGGCVRDIVFFVDRMEDGVGVMKDLELNAQALVKLDNSAWNFLKENKVVTPEVFYSLTQRAEDKQRWAERMLESRAGQKRLAQLFDDERTREKVRKILTKGYSHMTDELIAGIRRYSTSGVNLSEWLAKV